MYAEVQVNFTPDGGSGDRRMSIHLQCGITARHNTIVELQGRRLLLDTWSHINTVVLSNFGEILDIRRGNYLYFYCVVFKILNVSFLTPKQATARTFSQSNRKYTIKIHEGNMKIPFASTISHTRTLHPIKSVNPGLTGRK